MARDPSRARARQVAVLVVVAAFATALGGGCGGDVPTNYLERGNAASKGGKAGSGGLVGGAGGDASAGDGAGGDAAGGDTSGSGGKGGGSGGKGGTLAGGSGGLGGGTSGAGGTAGGSGLVCGDGKTEGDEQCDDGNVVDQDGCSSVCTESCEACESWYAQANGGDETKDGFYCGLHSAEAGCASVQGFAASGLGQGSERSALCLAVVACVRRTNCVVSADGSELLGVSYCYCGDNCTSPNGPCQFEFEAAAESSSPGEVAGRFSNYDVALGYAVDLVDKCDVPHCYEQCFQGAPWSEPVGGAGGQ